jgi:2-polyprenyl-3-methyl-5-hydroxy-6-metoxy-1,4-benzoquinol methylase
MKNTCPNCADDHSKKLFSSYDRLRNIPTSFHGIYKCDVCKLVFVSPQAKKEDYENYYDSSYVSHYAIPKVAKPVSKRSKKMGEFRAMVWQYVYGVPLGLTVKISWLKMFFLQIFKRSKYFRIRPINFKNSGIRVLDVGSGSGSYIWTLKNLGWKVSGLEASDSMVKQSNANSLDVYCGFSIAEYWNTPSFDFITLNQVFEHVDDSKKMLNEIHQSLFENGVLIMNLPNVESVPMHIFKSFWYGLDSPRHNVLYSPRVLKKMLNENGFNVISMYTASSTSGWSGSIEYLLRDFLHLKISSDQIRKNKWVNSFFKPIVKLCDLLGIGDNLYVFAKKQS